MTHSTPYMPADVTPLERRCEASFAYTTSLTAQHHCVGTLTPALQLPNSDNAGRGIFQGAVEHEIARTDYAVKLSRLCRVRARVKGEAGKPGITKLRFQLEAANRAAVAAENRLRAVLALGGKDG